METLSGKKVALIATNGFEERELHSPKEALEQAGAKVDVLAPEEDVIRGWQEETWGDSLKVDSDVGLATADKYDALMLPGGVLNADSLRGNDEAVRLVREFVKAGKPIAAICHAPWLLIEAGSLEGRRITSYHTLKSDLTNAGAKWVDEAAVVDGNLLTSRSPADLPQFNAQMVKLFAREPRPAVGDAEQSEPAEIGTEMSGEVTAPKKTAEAKLDAEAKMREDNEGPSAPPAKTAAQGLQFDGDHDKDAGPKRAVTDEDVDTSDIEASKESHGMGSKGRKFTGARHHKDDSADVSARRPKEVPQATQSPKPTAPERGATRRGKAEVKESQPAGRGLSTKFAARRETSSNRMPRAK